MTFKEACDYARSESEKFGCVQHVEAVVALVDGEPQVIGCNVSDWVGEGTLVSYYNGREV